MIENTHERLLSAPLAVAGELIDRLSSEADALWPRESWPPLRFDGPLAVGARGGHGPVRYFVSEYEPGRRVLFRFTAPRGFNGTHGFAAEEIAPGVTCLRHSLEMRAAGWARLTWPLAFRWLHDALIEDALDRAEAFCAGQVVQPREWSLRVRLLRRIFAAGQRGVLSDRRARFPRKQQSRTALNR